MRYVLAICAIFSITTISDAQLVIVRPRIFNPNPVVVVSPRTNAIVAPSFVQSPYTVSQFVQPVPLGVQAFVAPQFYNVPSTLIVGQPQFLLNLDYSFNHNYSRPGQSITIR